LQCLQCAPGRRVTEKCHFSTLNVGLAGTGNRTQATCLAGSVSRRSAIDYAFIDPFLQGNKKSQASKDETNDSLPAAFETEVKARASPSQLLPRLHFVKFSKVDGGKTSKCWECGVCGKEFANQGGLVRHIPTHTGQLITDKLRPRELLLSYFQASAVIRVRAAKSPLVTAQRSRSTWRRTRLPSARSPVPTATRPLPAAPSSTRTERPTLTRGTLRAASAGRRSAQRPILPPTK
jgi:hypothetical protein